MNRISPGDPSYPLYIQLLAEHKKAAWQQAHNRYPDNPVMACVAYHSIAARLTAQDFTVEETHDE